MGRITASVEILNPADKGGAPVRLDALVDTGASYLTLPLAWKERFGEFMRMRQVQVQTATQETEWGTLCYPVLVTVEGFPETEAAILFLEMKPEEGKYEPLLGYIPLESCGAAVDMLGHRLLPVKYMDLKKIVIIQKEEP